jgi:Fe-S-cluster containining protein
MDLKAERLAVKARNSLSTYCYSECKAYCCRKGYLLMSEKETILVAGVQMKKIKENNSLTAINTGEYMLHLGAHGQSCPSLKEFRCEIHKNPNRPLACKEFPLFIWKNKKIRVSSRCPAVNEGLLYPYLARFKLMGYSYANKSD